MKVELVDQMGSDISVVNAARVSFAKESSLVENCPCGSPGDTDCDLVCQFTLDEPDRKLVNYLAKHKHWSPFAHCFLSFRISAPIFVARQLVKHQIGLAWNEVLRRYVSDVPTCFVPEEIRARPDASIKQGSGHRHDNSPDIIRNIRKHHTYCVAIYNALIDDGVAPEQARMILPQSMYTEWIWSGSLMAFARVCKLRLDPHAQGETRVIAEQINAHAEDIFPDSWKALMEHG